VTLETLFDEFDRLVDAPGAIDRFRALILRLATTGRIALQDPADQPAAELLREIFEHRDALLKESLRRLRIDRSAITAGDDAILPPSWSRCTISEVCELQTGATPSRQEAAYFGGDIPWLVSGDVNRRQIFEANGRITEDGLANSNCKVIKRDSVLIALNGQGRTRGTVAILRIPAALNQSLVSMTPYLPERLLPEYLYWNLRGRYYAIRDITGQDQRRGLNMKLIARLSLPIPPLDEQKRIVAKVDDLMTLCDRLQRQQQEREKWHAVLSRAAVARFAGVPTVDNLSLLFHDSYSIEPDDLRKSILALAVTGKLVRQDTDVTLRGAGKSHDGMNFATVSSVAQIPQEWSLAPLDAVADEIVDCPHSTPKWTSNGKICVRTNQFSPGYLDLSRSRFVSERTFEERIKRLRPQQDDILYSREGGILGVACRVPPNTELCLGQRMMLIRCGSSIEPAFLEMVLNAPTITGLARQQTTGGAAPRINVSTVKAYPIPVPPLAEQRRIVTKVNELMSLVDALDTQLSTARDIGARLVDAVVGDLTSDSQRGGDEA
jgi:type I restriction enzyme, S subunit